MDNQPSVAKSHRALGKRYEFFHNYTTSNANPAVSSYWVLIFLTVPKRIDKDALDQYQTPDPILTSAPLV